MRDELGGNIMTEFVALRPKAKKCVIKRNLKLINYKKCLLSDEIISKSQQRIKNEGHGVHTEKVRKIALSNNDDKRLQTYDKIATSPYGAVVGRVCKTGLLSKVKLIY